jgi:hypothetical protein
VRFVREASNAATEATALALDGVKKALGDHRAGTDRQCGGVTFGNGGR